MPPFTLANLAAYCAQVLLIAGAAGLLLAMLRVDAPRFRYVLLRITLVACLALPWLQTPQPRTPTAGASTTVTFDVVEQPAAPGGATLGRDVDWTTVTAIVLVAGIVLRILWLAVGLLRLSRLRRAGVRADDADVAELQQTMGTCADVRYVGDFAQPVTFGLRKPVVVLPESLRAQTRPIRDAVLAHELLHVQRRDWVWVLAEEATRAVFWFHPAIWWLVSRVQLAREEVVDALAVARTGCRRAYIEALMAFADEAPLAPAPAFARKRHLFRRMVLISREDVMTGKRLVLSSTAVVALMATGGWYVVQAFPLSGGDQILRLEPGPLEVSAHPITPENPVPRRTHHEPAQYPVDAAADNASAGVTLRMTVDSSGTVAEARATAVRFRNSAGITLSFSGTDAIYKFLEESLPVARARQPIPSLDSTKRAINAFVQAAAAAVEQWRFERPANAPIAFDTTFYFTPQQPVSDTPGAAPPPPPPPPPPPDEGVKRLVGFTGLRVGDQLPPPTKIKDVRPFYPPDAMDAKVQGVVVMDIRIDENGRVSDAAILRSIPMLDQAALDAVKQWEFTPTLLNGAPIPVIVTVTINFTLK